MTQLPGDVASWSLIPAERGSVLLRPRSKGHRQEDHLVLYSSQLAQSVHGRSLSTWQHLPHWLGQWPGPRPSLTAPGPGAGHRQGLALQDPRMGDVAKSPGACHLGLGRCPAPRANLFLHVELGQWVLHALWVVPAGP